MSTSSRTVSREEWTRARKALLEREKAFDRERDALSAARRELPRVKLDKSYVFEEAGGARRTLLELFDGKPQLITYHFMFAPGWQEGCRGCSYVSDNVQGGLSHLAARDTAYVAISRAPIATLEAFKKRMGWTFRWLSSAETDFNYDLGASFRPEDVAAGTATYNYAKLTSKATDLPGLSVFSREGDDVFHTYSTFSRGLDMLLGTYHLLDLTPLGRHEEGLSHSMAWVRLHDQYGVDGKG